jgi:hypothetical protein
VSVASSELQPDYYAVLQVHPDADSEVIEAAYRQLMKKHHPDVAGNDPRRVAAHHARSKAINQAFSVLRDPEQRMRYDDARERIGTRRPTRPHRPRSAPPAGAASAAAPPYQGPPTIEVPADEPSTRGSILLAPFVALCSAYYLLPGPYEWEPGRRKELLAVLMLPFVGTAGFCLATGRLSPLIGHTFNTTVIAAAVLVLLALPVLKMLPRIAMAALPSIALLTGVLDPVLQQAHVPIWLAWGLLNALSLILAARVYVFSFLPTLGICWLITRFS